MSSENTNMPNISSTPGLQKGHLAKVPVMTKNRKQSFKEAYFDGSQGMKQYFGSKVSIAHTLAMNNQSRSSFSSKSGLIPKMKFNEHMQSDREAIHRKSVSKEDYRNENPLYSQKFNKNVDLLSSDHKKRNPFRINPNLQSTRYQMASQ